MTRINVVPPSELSGKHLVAEYHELPRVVGFVRGHIAKGIKATDKHGWLVPAYTMGRGHIKFFFHRLGFIEKRFSAIVKEMEFRGYKPKFRTLPTRGIPNEWFGDYIPTPEALAINRERLRERSPLQKAPATV